MGNPFSVITGASRGIGAEYARALGTRGHDLLLVARDGLRLLEVAADIRRHHHVSVETEVLDLALPNAAYQLHAAACQRRPVIDVLVNNAGFGLYGPFTDMPLQSIQQMLQLHIMTIVESIRLFLPTMIARQSGTIINVASVAGLLPIPFCAEYAATKAFLVSFSESLAEEVRSAGVKIQACCPGQTQTDFHETAGFQPQAPMGMQSTQEVVRTSLGSLDQTSPVITIGWQGMISALLARWAPRNLLVGAVGKRMKPPTGLK